MIYNDNEWFFTSDLTTKPQKGDLVVLSAVRSPTEWYLSWYVDSWYDCETVYLLKSIETEKLCKWTNVGIEILNRDIVNQYPRWKWTDKQYEFTDKWYRACKKGNSYLHVPCEPEFTDDGKGVILNIRKKFESAKYESQKVFDNWKKLLVRDMLEYYNSMSRFL